MGSLYVSIQGTQVAVIPVLDLLPAFLFGVGASVIWGVPPLRRSFLEILKTMGFRKRKSPEIRALHRAKAAVKDMTEWKEKRRIEERQKWRNEFEALAGPPEPEFLPVSVSNPKAAESAGARCPHCQHFGYPHKEGRGPCRTPGCMCGAYESREPSRRGPLRESAEFTIVNGAGEVIVQGGGPARKAGGAIIMVGSADGSHSKAAYPVRQGKYVGHYVLHERDGDALLDDDLFSIIETYADGHYSTCPYECDCPKWARREP